jgi:uncharacterized protein YbcI
LRAKRARGQGPGRRILGRSSVGLGVPLPKETEANMGPEASPQESRSQGELAQKISNALVALMREYTGRGPTRSRTYVHENLIVCVMHDWLTKGERSLMSSGEKEFVLEIRRRFQNTMRPEMIKLVERLTGRKVVAFMSDNHVDPDVAAETFVLELREGDPTTPTG